MESIKNYWKWIVSILLIIVLFVVIYKKKDSIFKEIEFNPINIETTNVITNTTDRDFYDEIVLVGLNELGVDSVFVSIKDLTDGAKGQLGPDIELKAHIIGRGNQYMIWIDDIGKREAVEVLSHELIHLLQYRNKDIILEKEYVEWKGTKYTYEELKEMDYKTRPWEIEAFENDDNLKYKLEKILYKTTN